MIIETVSFCCTFCCQNQGKQTVIRNESPKEQFLKQAFLLFFFFKYFYLFLVMLYLPCWVQAFSSSGKLGLLIVVCRLLIAVAPLVAEHRLQGTVSIVLVHELICSKAGGILLDQGLNPGVPCTGRWIPIHCATREVSEFPGLERSPGGRHGSSRILDQRIPWKEEPGGLQSMGSQSVGHD